MLCKESGVSASVSMESFVYIQARGDVMLDGTKT